MVTICFSVGAAEPSPEQLKFFESSVRPLLVENCFSCHSAKKQKGGLRLDSLAAVLKGGKNGPVVVPGKPAASPLVTAVSYHDPDLQMPPDEQLSPAQVEILSDWVRMGAPWPANEAKIQAPLAKQKKRLITDVDRGFWSFQPVKDSPVPPVRDAAWCRNPIDHFILAKLQTEGLSPAMEADRITFIRRATFDLHGLPPTSEEVDAFARDTSPTAYEALIDRLLASPRYGEQWARHWLDLVRYAESDGFKQDAYRANAWPYRDYVIKSFNEDKPYDRFVTEQLAGDEIAPNDPAVTVATGYLRGGIYEYNNRDVARQWSQMLDDVTDVTGDALLGLSMGCARCHDHKFDPILQADYYRLRSFFAPMLPRNDLPLATVAQIEAHEKAMAAWVTKAGESYQQLLSLEKQPGKRLLASAATKFPDETKAILLKPAEERSPYEKQLAYLALRQVYDAAENAPPKLIPAEKEKYDALKKELAATEAERPKPLLKGLVMTDVGPVAPEVTIPGDPKHPIKPGYLKVLEGKSLELPSILPSDHSTGRRTALAKWITQPGNPLTTRVITNRIWQFHFGRGLVATSSDFGRLGTPATHPELLDWLATRFVESGWSIKAMHRMILTSATYRQAAIRPVPEVARLQDPENRWLWRMNTRRLDSEQVRDAMLSASGELRQEMGGPSAEQTSPRRAIYTKALRNTRDPLLDVFDAPEAFGSIAVRNVTTTANQALLMINGDWPLKRAAAFAAEARRRAGSSDPAAIVESAYRAAYGRSPQAQELSRAVAFLKQHSDSIEKSEPSADTVNPASEVSIEAPVTQTMPQRGGQAILIRNASPADMLRLPEAGSLLSTSFTVEAYVQLESLYENAEVRVIASQWDGDHAHPGWALGVTCEKSKYQPRNLILQIATPGNGKADGYEVIPSDFRIELHKAYYVAASVNLKEPKKTGVTFYLKDLTDMDAPLKSIAVAHRQTGSVESKIPLMIGGRLGGGAGKSPQGWDGLIDEVRISNSALQADQILYNEGDAKGLICGHWLFKEHPGFFKDSSGQQKDLTRLASPSMADAYGKPRSPKADAALIDFCHVLLNSSEFLYVD